MFSLWACQGGALRIALPLPAFTALMLAPSTALMLLITAPPHQWPSARRIMSIPLLIIVILLPLCFTSHYKVPDLVAAVLCFNAFLRFTELFWVGPVLQARPVYASSESLHVDFWSAMRTFPKKPKDGKDGKANDVKVYQKDKKFYHILLYFTYHAIVSEVLGTWFTSFSAEDLATMKTRQPVNYFLFFVGAIFVLSSMFNAVGYLMQLVYCIYYERGSYCSEQWRMLMENPFLAASLDDIWSYRWHQIMRSTWLALPFRPVRQLARGALNNRIKSPTSFSILLAALSVFLISGLMHEYIILCNVGIDTYKRLFVGQQQFFFTCHGVAVIFERLIQQVATRILPASYRQSVVVQIIQRVWVIGFCFLYFSKFFDAFVHWGVHYEHPFQVFRSMSTELFRAPALRPFVGSLV